MYIHMRVNWKLCTTPFLIKLDFILKWINVSFEEIELWLVNFSYMLLWRSASVAKRIGIMDEISFSHILNNLQVQIFVRMSSSYIIVIARFLNIFPICMFQARNRSDVSSLVATEGSRIARIGKNIHTYIRPINPTTVE